MVNGEQESAPRTTAANWIDLGHEHKGLDSLGVAPPEPVALTDSTTSVVSVDPGAETSPAGNPIDYDG